jgi:hypothetical protein
MNNYIKEENLTMNDFIIENHETDNTKIIISKKLYKCFKKIIKESIILEKEVNEIKKELILLKTTQMVINGNIIIKNNI